MQPQSILHFWFEELTDKQHFVKDAALDETIHNRFSETLEAAAKCELFVEIGGNRGQTPICLRCTTFGSDGKRL